MATLRSAAKESKISKEQDNTLVLHSIKLGDAAHYPSYGDTVGVHYVASIDGVEVDNSSRRGQLLYFILGVGQVIPGWDDVLPRMSLGQRVRVDIHPGMAYGPAGYPPIIPPNTSITYEIELVTFSSVGNNEAVQLPR